MEPWRSLGGRRWRPSNADPLPPKARPVRCVDSDIAPDAASRRTGSTSRAAAHRLLRQPPVRRVILHDAPDYAHSRDAGDTFPPTVNSACSDPDLAFKQLIMGRTDIAILEPGAYPARTARGRPCDEPGALGGGQPLAGFRNNWHRAGAARSARHRGRRTWRPPRSRRGRAIPYMAQILIKAERRPSGPSDVQTRLGRRHQTRHRGQPPPSRGHNEELPIRRSGLATTTISWSPRCWRPTRS